MIPLPPLNLANRQMQNPISGANGSWFSEAPIIYTNGGDVSGAVGGMPTPATTLAGGIVGAANNDMVWIIGAGLVALFMVMAAR